MVGVDAMTDFYSGRIKQSNLIEVRKNDHFKLVEGDLGQIRIEPLLEGTEVVFHLAGQPGVRTSWEDQFGLYLQHNVLATQRLMEACRNVTPGRVVYTSSSSIYGNSPRLPVGELTCGHPASPYGATKLAAEHICDLYSENFAIPVVTLRLFTVYGPRQRPDMAFHRFIRAGLSGTTISVYGDGGQSRDFTYVDDVVAAAIAAGARGRSGAKYNVGGGATWTVGEVLNVIAELVGATLDVKYLEPSVGDVRDTSADTTQARHDLGFDPQTNVELGLRNQVDWTRRAIAQDLFAGPS